MLVLSIDILGIAIFSPMQFLVYFTHYSCPDMTVLKHSLHTVGEKKNEYWNPISAYLSKKRNSCKLTLMLIIRRYGKCLCNILTFVDKLS